MAEIEGWRELEKPAKVYVGFQGYDNFFWIDPKGFPAKAPPDYPHDLNAVHEVVMHLKSKDRFNYQVYHSILVGIVAKANSSLTDDLDFDGCYESEATSAQRTEAILRTYEKWKE